MTTRSLSHQGGETLSESRECKDFVTETSDSRYAISTIANLGSLAATIDILDKYTGTILSERVDAGASVSDRSELSPFDGWYDVVITVEHDSAFGYQLAGHLETGKDSISDPAMGGLV